MRLGARWLKDVGGPNIFQMSQAPEFYQGDVQTLYLMLVDEEAVVPANMTGPASRRYCPAAGAVLTVLLDSVDDAQQVTKILSQPFPGDASIWTLPIASADPVSGTVDLLITLNEGGVQHTARLNGGLRIRPTARV